MSGKFLPFAGRRDCRNGSRRSISCLQTPQHTCSAGLLRLAHLLLLLTGKGVIRMFENIFGIHEQALLLQGQRIGILATNLANADTPNYKARDIDFSAVLSKSDAAPLPLSVTDGAHINLNDPTTPSADLKFRN